MSSRSLYSEPAPGAPPGVLKCSLIPFHPSDGEFPFFSWSDWTRFGPGISRAGINPPFMRTAWDAARPWATTEGPEAMRRWCYYIDEDGMEVDRRVAAGQPACSKPPASIELRQIAFSRYVDGLRGAVHPTQFRRRRKGWGIIGQVGSGDTTMNPWHVAFVWDGGAPKFLYLEDEPIRERQYPCLIKWAGEPDQQAREEDRDHFSMELNARFMPDAGRPELFVDDVDRIKEIEFALSGKPLLNRSGNIIPLNQITHFFRDLRHLFNLPNIRPTAKSAPAIMFGQPITADLWFGEKQLLDDVNLQRAACKGPVLLDRLYGGLSVTREYLRAALLDGRIYTEARAWVGLLPGQFRIDEYGTGVEIYFREAMYPWNIIAVGRYVDRTSPRAGQRVLLSLACGGLSGRSHYTLREAVDRLKNVTENNGIALQGALLLDEGGDVFQKVDHSGTGASLEPTLLDPLKPVDPLTFPDPLLSGDSFACQRRLVRCCLFFARKLG